MAVGESRWILGAVWMRCLSPPCSVSILGSGSWQGGRHSIRGRQLQTGAQAGGMSSRRPGTHWWAVHGP